MSRRARYNPDLESIIGVGPVLRPTTQRCKKRAQLQGRHICTLTIRGCAPGCVAPGAIQPGFGEYICESNSSYTHIFVLARGWVRCIRCEKAAKGCTWFDLGPLRSFLPHPTTLIHDKDRLLLYYLQLQGTFVLVFLTFTTSFSFVCFFLTRLDGISSRSFGRQTLLHSRAT